MNKGVQQGFATHQAYKRGGNEPFEPFILVVTYQNMYLGSGNSYANLIGKRVIDKLQREYDLECHVPVTNIFFLDIIELEKLCVLIREEKIGMTEFLRWSYQRSITPEERRFNMEQYIEDYKSELNSPQFLLERFDEEFDRVALRIKDQRDTRSSLA